MRSQSESEFRRSKVMLDLSTMLIAMILSFRVFGVFRG
jgi:hypothetical protein